MLNKSPECEHNNGRVVHTTQAAKDSSVVDNMACFHTFTGTSKQIAFCCLQFGNINLEL